MKGEEKGLIEISGIRLPVDTGRKQLEDQIMKKLRLKKLADYRILKRSIDARKKPIIYYVYSVGVTVPDERQILKRVNDKNITSTNRKPYHFPVPGSQPMKHHPLIVGTGPAGLFCALLLARQGYAPVIIDRGSSVEQRVRAVQEFWQNGKLDPNCNVQFGEGGAGTFSDGKLNTQVKDPYGRIRFILEEFVRHGAPESILYDSKPHIGTDLLVHVVKEIREEITSLGGSFLFDTCLSDLGIEKGQLNRVHLFHNGFDTWVDVDHVILAIGHSARDTFFMLQNHQVHLEQKAFAIGVRVEHPEAWIRKALYGESAAANRLPSPPYRLTFQTEAGRGVYSFCMCPGGYVVNASSEPGHTAVNGMSYSGRSGQHSNSAIVVTVRTSDFPDSSPLAGIRFQRELEAAVFHEGNGSVVCQRFEDFCANTPTTRFGCINPQIKGLFRPGNLYHCLPREIADAIIEGIHSFEHSIPGFSHPDTVLSGVESRTSSPVRITRDADFESNIKGLHPCGEGAGYAGGIMSAAMDGMKTAEAIISKYAR